LRSPSSAGSCAPAVGSEGTRGVITAAWLRLIPAVVVLALTLVGFIVLIVVASPTGIVGVLETIRNRRRPPLPNSASLASRIETAK